MSAHQPAAPVDPIASLFSRHRRSFSFPESPHVPNEFNARVADGRGLVAVRARHRTRRAPVAPADHERDGDRVRVRRGHLGRGASRWRRAADHEYASRRKRSAIFSRWSVDRVHLQSLRHAVRLRGGGARRRAHSTDVVPRPVHCAWLDPGRRARALCLVARHGTLVVQSSMDCCTHRGPVHDARRCVGQQRGVLTRWSTADHRSRRALGCGMAQLSRRTKHTAPDSRPRVAQRSEVAERTFDGYRPGVDRRQDLLPFRSQLGGEHLVVRCRHQGARTGHPFYRRRSQITRRKRERPRVRAGRLPAHTRSGHRAKPQTVNHCRRRFPVGRVALGRRDKEHRVRSTFAYRKARADGVARRDLHGAGRAGRYAQPFAQRGSRRSGAGVVA